MKKPKSLRICRAVVPLFLDLATIAMAIFHDKSIPSDPKPTKREIGLSDDAGFVLLFTAPLLAAEGTEYWKRNSALKQLAEIKKLIVKTQTQN